jgi:diacylglycerol kinase (ATP)
MRIEASSCSREFPRLSEPAHNLDVVSTPALLETPEPPDERWDRDLEESPELTARADRRNALGKFAAGCRGLKHATRGDSSFFAHAYRGLLIAITAALVGVNQWGWCFLVIAGSLVLLAELAHSAVDTLARAVGDAEEPRLKMAREIAAAGVLVAVIGAVIIVSIVLGWQISQQSDWLP